ncbi:hypothetical protein K7432_004944 [Basidiobolus ranarum]|uniref:Uncharacterized protein n=1 Tax=Basidiobolus ranarum TaxID=34480 RepID=A0ABR2W411_9FUNG
MHWPALKSTIVILLASLTVAKECSICPSDKPVTVPLPNPPVPEANGCGPKGLGVFVPEYLFAECCNAHDLCYSDCGRTKGQCDTTFLKCMETVCDTQRAKNPRLCQRLATVYHDVVAADSSCVFYKNSLKNYCQCKA